jgi:hypothetical protein
MLLPETKFCPIPIKERLVYRETAYPSAEFALAYDGLRRAP